MHSASSACASSTSPTGDQPIYNEDRSVVVVLNGEIYNYRELRIELTRAGIASRLPATRRRSCTSTRSTARLRQLAARDVRVRDLGPAPAASVLARDRVGKKPLFYPSERRGSAFASELERPDAGPAIPREVGPPGDRRYLAFSTSRRR